MSNRDTTLRPLKADDIVMFSQWFSAPHVAPWWDGITDQESLQSKYLPCLEPQSATRVYIIQVDQKPVGMIQSYHHCRYPAWERTVAIKNAMGIDYVVGAAEHIGKGVGTHAIKMMTKMALTLHSDIDVVVAVPQKDNLASRRALEKAGFALVREAKLESDCPSDAVSAIYQRHR